MMPTQREFVTALIIAVLVAFVIPMMTFLNPLFQRFGRFAALAATGLGALAGLVLVRKAKLG